VVRLSQKRDAARLLSEPDPVLAADDLRALQVASMVRLSMVGSPRIRAVAEGDAGQLRPGPLQPSGAVPTGCRVTAASGTATTIRWSVPRSTQGRTTTGKPPLTPSTSPPCSTGSGSQPVTRARAVVYGIPDSRIWEQSMDRRDSQSVSMRAFAERSSVVIDVRKHLRPTVQLGWDGTPMKTVTIAVWVYVGVIRFGRRVGKRQGGVLGRLLDPGATKHDHSTMIRCAIIGRVASPCHGRGPAAHVVAGAAGSARPTVPGTRPVAEIRSRGPVAAASGASERPRSPFIATSAPAQRAPWTIAGRLPGLTHAAAGVGVLLAWMRHGPVRMHSPRPPRAARTARSRGPHLPDR
jgi:hypothetical protein